MQGGYRRTADLPQVIPVFPLDGALLLPGSDLPLRIFEPRYLNMVDAAMDQTRVIGMIQPRDAAEEKSKHPALAQVPFILEVPGLDGKGPDLASVSVLKRLAGRPLEATRA